MSHWQGEANTLSQEHVAWDAIDNVALACEKPETNLSAQNELHTTASKSPPHHSDIKAHDLIQQRRSAVAMDKRTQMQAIQFYSLLSRLMPDIVETTYNVLLTTARVQLILFVHRVEEISSGVYCLIRGPGALDSLKTQMNG